MKSIAVSLFALIQISILSPLLVSETANAEAVPGRYLIKFRDQSKTALVMKQYGLQVKKNFPEVSLVSVQARSGFSTLNLKSIEADPAIEYIEPVYVVRLSLTPDDPKSSSRRGLGLEGAWDITTGNPNIVIGISDTGVNFDHEDLQANMWRNANEISGNGIDDDRNGFVDDVHGWNFHSNTAAYKDDHNHGSHVAGLAAAVGNNGVGVAGATWKAQLMSLKFISRSGSGSTEGGIETILYAVRNGAHIINASWGGGDYSQALRDAIAYAGEKNVLFVCAAGNDGANVDRKPHYPSGYNLPNMLVVAATNGRSSLASFSNYGRTKVHVGAPGVDLIAPSASSSSSYMLMSGTSMATPLAAGVAALVLASRPDISIKDWRNALLNSVGTQFKSRVASGGAINATKAVSQLSVANQVWPARMSLKVGDTFGYTAWGVSSPVKWVSSNSAVATVAADGTVTAVSAGATKIGVVDAAGKKFETEELVVLN